MIGVPSADGRTLADPGDPLARVPAPIVSMDARKLVGRIDKVWVDGNELRYSGELDNESAELVRQKRAIAHLDASSVGLQETETGIEMTGWQVVAASLGDPEGCSWPQMYMTVSARES